MWGKIAQDRVGINIKISIIVALTVLPHPFPSSSQLTVYMVSTGFYEKLTK
jgi:hypothetical protein